MDVPNAVPAWLIGIVALGMAASQVSAVGGVEKRMRAESLPQVRLALRAGLAMQAGGGLLYLVGAPRVFAHATFVFGAIGFFWGLYRAGELQPRRR